MPYTYTSFTDRTLHVASEFNTRFTTIETFIASLDTSLNTIVTPSSLPSLSTLLTNVSSLTSTLNTRQANVNTLKTNVDTLVTTHNTNVGRLSTINTNLTTIESAVASKALGVGTVDKATIPAFFKNMVMNSGRPNRLLMIDANGAGYWDRPSTSINVRSQAFTARYETATNVAFGTPTADTWTTTPLTQVFSNVKNIFAIPQTVISGGNVSLPSGLWMGFSDQTFINKGAYSRFNGSLATFYSTVGHGVTTSDTVSTEGSSAGWVEVSDANAPASLTHDIYAKATTSSVTLGRVQNQSVNPEISNNVLFIRWIAP